MAIEFKDQASNREKPQQQNPGVQLLSETSWSRMSRINHRPIQPKRKTMFMRERLMPIFTLTLHYFSMSKESYGKSMYNS